jgi:hypothetical protein
MDLEKIRPENIKLEIKRTGNEYEFRLVNLLDETWLKKQYGEKLAELFTNESVDMDPLCRLAFRLLVDKSDFKKIETNSIDEDGNEVVKTIGGYKLFMSKFQGEEEKTQLLVAIGRTINNSRPEVKEEKEIKKKVIPRK